MEIQTIIAILATLGIGGLLAQAFKMIARNRSERQRRLDASYAADVDADKHGFNIINENYKAAMAEMKEIRAELKDLAVTNATLAAQNEAMKHTNDSQTKEIEHLREQLELANNKTLSFESDLKNEKLRHDVTRQELRHTQLELAELQQQVASLLDEASARKAVTDAQKGAARRALSEQAKAAE